MHAHEPQAEQPAPTGDEGRLSGVRPLAHDEDERPSAEDRSFGRSIFDIPVKLPRWLRPRRGE